MTEANANGPAATQTTAPEATATPAPVQGGESATTWIAGLQDGDNRDYAGKKNWKSPDDAVKSQRELEKLLGNSIRLPGENATPEEKAAFRAKMGVPEKPEGYEFKLDPASVPADFPYDEASAGKYRNWAHELGLPPKQAQELHDKFVSEQAAAFAAAKTAQLETEKAAHREIVSDWGEPTTPSYTKNLGVLQKALVPALQEHPGLKEFFDQTGVLSTDGAIKNAAFAKWFLPYANELHGEASATPGTATSSPPKKDAATILYGS